MALNRKYAALPDLDSAPDLYETPELTDDNSTAPTGRAHSESNASSYKDFDEHEDEGPGISRSRLHPDQARTLFSSAQIDARGVDFSDRVTAKRKSYKASTRRHRRREDGTEEYGDFSDDQDGESLERKLARLKREIQEVKEEYGKRQDEDKDGEEQDTVYYPQDVTDLNKMLDEMSLQRGPMGRSAGGKFAKDLGTGIKANGPPQTAQGYGESATYTITYAPTYQQSHALAKAADFDGRLALLEKALGISAAELLSSTANGVPKAILPTLDTLQRQVSVISESTPSSLDSISRRVRALTQETERLDEARKAAKAQAGLRLSGSDVVSDDEEDSEQIAKINALYGTLSTIESLAPLLPSLLDRLRSLRAIHADAATASASLDRVEKQQTEMAGDLKKWREGLGQVEVALRQGESVMSDNMKAVEGWVKELEQKMENL